MDIEKLLYNIRIVDTETTSPKPDDAELIELAIGDYNDGKWITDNKLFKPTIDIPPEASAVNNISNKMVEYAPSWKLSINLIKDMVTTDKILVAHNSKFDSKIISNTLNDKSFLDEKKWICTFRLAKVLYGNDSSITQYNMNYLRYRLNLAVDDNLVPHRAESDVAICAALFIRLVNDALAQKLVSQENLLNDLNKLTWEVVPLKTFPFGKYKGKEFKDVPIDYLEWAVKNMDSLNEKHSNYDPAFAEAVVREFETRT